MQPRGQSGQYDARNPLDAVAHRKEFLTHQERELNLISEAINGYCLERELHVPLA